MLFNITLLHAGVGTAFVSFLAWSLPVAVVMYGLALGVGKVGETLPEPVYPLLSGLNASTVGVVALAAVQLGQRTVTDKMTRVLVIWGACAGLCYSALWYFPVLILSGGATCMIWDVWVRRMVERLRIRWQRRKEPTGQADEAASVAEVESVEMAVIERQRLPTAGVSRRRPARSRERAQEAEAEAQAQPAAASCQADSCSQDEAITQNPSETQYYSVPIRTGVGLIAATFGKAIREPYLISSLTTVKPSSSSSSSLAPS